MLSLRSKTSGMEVFMVTYSYVGSFERLFVLSAAKLRTYYQSRALEVSHTRKPKTLKPSGLFVNNMDNIEI